MTRILGFGLAISGVLMTQTAHAHPGHAVNIADSNSGWHYLLQPAHGGMALLLALAFGFLVVLTRAYKARLARALRTQAVRTRRQ